ncbi:hypothetical protein EVAR_12864_1 [Eumeta japonica]|uniref:Uncharacterized protein n=1 Tax=Eumeta variegata TaxID=151549 RepID=A0A4C1TWQ7_EUMVA|nr:hypothetical protein EVAR_12864_1 [Eumeta japonica]
MSCLSNAFLYADDQVILLPLMCELQMVTEMHDSIKKKGMKVNVSEANKTKVAPHVVQASYIDPSKDYVQQTLYFSDVSGMMQAQQTHMVTRAANRRWFGLFRNDQFPYIFGLCHPDMPNHAAPNRRIATLKRLTALSEGSKHVLMTQYDVLLGQPQVLLAVFVPTKLSC